MDSVEVDPACRPDHRPAPRLRPADPSCSQTCLTRSPIAASRPGPTPAVEAALVADPSVQLEHRRQWSSTCPPITRVNAYSLSVSTFTFTTPNEIASASSCALEPLLPWNTYGSGRRDGCRERPLAGSQDLGSAGVGVADADGNGDGAIPASCFC